MKTMQNKLMVLFFIVLAFPHFASSQETNELRYEVNRIYLPLSTTRQKLQEAGTLIDLNKYYKSSWVKEYISVEILTSYKGKTRKAVSKNNVLSQEQNNIMNMADVGTNISVNVLYIPDNTLKHNEIKEIKFQFMVNPESEATYSSGQEELKQYLKDNIINKIPNGSFNELALAAVKFTIDKKGQITDAHIFETSRNKEIDRLLLKVINNMPNWKPAEYSNGTKVKQEFVLTIGNMESCVINLLNIRRN